MLNPLIFPPILCGWIVAAHGNSLRDISLAVGIVTACCSIWPGGLAFWMVRRGAARSLNMPSKQARVRAFTAGGLGYIAAGALIAVAALPATPLLLSVLGGFAFITFVVALITLRWKISAHAAAGAGFTAMLAVVAVLQSWSIHPLAVVAVGALLPLLMWARLHAGLHTAPQVITGALLGLTVPPVEFFILLETGIFTRL